MRKILFLMLGFALGSSLLLSQEADQKVGMTGAKFLALPVGPRASGMGEAYVAMADDASAAFWNPAGLAQVEGNEFFVSSTKWPADIQFEAAAVSLNAGGWGKMAIHILVLHMGDMRVRTAYFPDGTGEMFTASSLAGGISIAKSMTDRFSMGVSLKYIREDYYNVTANGWAIDIGSVYETGWRGMKIGMSMSNFGPDIAFDGTYKKWYDLEEPGEITDFEEYSIPLTFRFGVTVDVANFAGNNITLVADAIHPADNKEMVNIGAEMAVLGLAKIRVGYKMGADEGGLAAGAGIKLPFANTSADVSYTDFGLLGSVFSMSIGLGF